MSEDKRGEAIQVKNFIKTAIFLWHKLVSKSKLASFLYFRILSFVVRNIPNIYLKQVVLNYLYEVKWRVTLPAKRVRIRSEKFKIIPHAGEFDLEALVSKNISYEKENFAFLEGRAHQYDAILEIGANVGIYSLYFSKILASRRHNSQQPAIFSFEASAEAYRRLIMNLEIKATANVKAYNLAVGNETGFRDLYEPQGHLMNASFSREFAKIFSDSVKITKTFVIAGHEAASLLIDKKTVLIKMDVEGSEFEILTSMKAFIVERKPDIVVEVLKIYEDQLNELYFLREAGYQFFNITSNGLIRYENFRAHDQYRDFFLTVSSVDGAAI